MSGPRSITRRLLLLAALLVGARAKAQTPVDEAQVKAMFVYNFLKFVAWPTDTSERPRNPFVVLIIGEGATADATEKVLDAKLIGERPVVVRRIRWDQSLTGGRAVLVIERDTKKLRRVFDAAGTAGVLTIGEGDEFATLGGVIGMLVEERKIRFDIDTSAAQVAGLRVSSKLLALTRVIRPAPGGSGIRH